MVPSSSCLEKNRQEWWKTATSTSSVRPQHTIINVLLHPVSFRAARAFVPCYCVTWEPPCCHVPVPWKVSPWQPPKQRCPHGDLCAARTYLPTAYAHVLPDTAAASASSFLSHRLTLMPLQQAEGTACSPGHLQSPYIVFLSWGICDVSKKITGE